MKTFPVVVLIIVDPSAEIDRAASPDAGDVAQAME
jgi:hypothetical protein